MLKSDIILNKKNFFTDSTKLINFVFGFFPISFIFGNIITNANIVLFCALGIFHLRSKILKTKFNLPIKIIFLLFFVIFFSTSLSFIKSLYFEGYEYIHLVRLAKSILFFRYFLMLIVIYLLSELNLLNFKYFFITAAFSALLVALDVIYQSIFGFNIIGLKSHGTHNSGFFGDEWIAGGYMQNFSFFSILFAVFILKNKKNLRYILTAITVCILGTGIVLSGNRAPLVLLLLGLLLLFVFNKKLGKIILVSVICFFILFKFILSSVPLINIAYASLYENISELVLFDHIFKKQYDRIVLKKNTEIKYEAGENSILIKEKEQYSFPLYPQDTGFFSTFDPHVRMLLTSIDTWKRNKIFGNGIKSFRIDCYKIIGSAIYPEAGYNFSPGFKLFKRNRLCSNHPHNYYFEILTETGIVGLFVTLTIALLFVVFILKNFKLFKGENIENFILLAATISLILEVFPFKSTGSVFTTNDATYIILLSSIILSYKKRLFTSRE